MSKSVRMTKCFTVIQLLVMPHISFAQEPNSPPPIRTLKDAYTHALKHSERIAISEHLVREAESLYRQTRGLSLPALSYQHETTWEDNSGSSTESQGLFRLAKSDLTGYRELAALKAGKSAVRREEYQKQRIEQLLLRDIAGAFLGLLQARENVLSTKRLIELAQSRLKELRERVRVGRSRQVELIGQEFQIVSLESQLEETLRIMNARTDLVEYLVGAPVSEPEAPDSDFLITQEPIERYLARIDARPDVQAAQSNVDVFRGSVRIARSDYLPQMGLAANYYTYRPDDRDNVDWDASLDVGLPLWTWGARRGALHAARAVLHQSEQEWAGARRQAELDVRNAYRDLASAKKQMDFQRKAVDLARRDYELQVKDDRRNLVTSLEVLESLNRLNSAELALNNARLVMRLAALNLEIAAGAMPKEILK